MSYNITDSEWKIMQILWSSNGKKMSLAEIMEQLKIIQIDWNINTVRTFLTRLSEKNITGNEKIGKNYKYFAIAQERDCAVQETKSFLERVFGGSSSKLFSALVKSGGISTNEQNEILKIIENMKENSDDNLI